MPAPGDDRFFTELRGCTAELARITSGDLERPVPTCPGWTFRQLVTRTPSGVTTARGHGKADVAVRGPAASLLLVLTRRLPPSAPGIEVLGEQALLTHWLEHTPF